MKTYHDIVGDGGSDILGRVAKRAFMDIATQIMGRRVQGGAQ